MSRLEELVYPIWERAMEKTDHAARMTFRDWYQWMLTTTRGEAVDVCWEEDVDGMRDEALCAMSDFGKRK